MLQHVNLREYIDQLRSEGYTVRGSKHEDPVLIAPNGSAVETWREGYPYIELIDRELYEEEKYRLQVELLKFQYWSRTSGPSTSSSSRVGTRPARAARSSGSWST
jgi:hypothetical protein